MNDQKKKHQQDRADDETMFVDKKARAFEDQAAEGGFTVAHSDDSRANRLHAESFEDHQQIFTKEKDKEGKPEAAENTAEQ